MLKKQFLACLIAVLGFLQFGFASAATLDLIPSSNSVIEGDTFTVDVVISDLGIGEIVSAFDLDVLYTPSLLMATDVQFTDNLGSIFFFEALAFSDISVPGTAQFDEVSLLFDFELDLIQSPLGGSFKLAELSFLAIAAGLNTFEFGSTLIVGAFDPATGLPTEIDSINGMATVSVSPIPLPGALWLMISGLIGIGAMARKRGSANQANNI